MADPIQDLLGKAQTLRAQAQDARDKAAQSGQYASGQRAKMSQLLAALPQPAPGGAPATSGNAGCLFAFLPGAKKLAEKKAQAAPPLAPLAPLPTPDPKLDGQLAECERLIELWQARADEYRKMAQKLDADAALLEQRAAQQQQAQAEAPITQTPAVTYKAVLRRTDIDAPPLGEVLDEPFMADAVNVKRSNQRIIGNSIRDTMLNTPKGQALHLAEVGHRDAIQLIPDNQFAAGVLEGVIINNNAIQSAGKLQGVFASDGVFRNLSITFNTIDTLSAHKITLNGLVGPYNQIEGNRDASGALVRVELNPIRLGGNVGTGNVWVLSVAAEDQLDYGYGAIDIGGDMSSAENPFQHITDHRSVPQYRDKANGDTNLKSFPMTLFKQQLATATLQTLLDQDCSLDAQALAWLVRLEALPDMAATPARVEKAKQVYASQRHVPILELNRHSPDVQNFCIQALAKTFGVRV